MCGVVISNFVSQYVIFKWARSYLMTIRKIGSLLHHYVHIIKREMQRLYGSYITRLRIITRNLPLTAWMAFLLLLKIEEFGGSASPSSSAKCVGAWLSDSVPSLLLAAPSPPPSLPPINAFVVLRCVVWSIVLLCNSSYLWLFTFVTLFIHRHLFWVNWLNCKAAPAFPQFMIWSDWLTEIWMRKVCVSSSSYLFFKPGLSAERRV